VSIAPRALESLAKTLAEKAKGEGRDWQRGAVARFKCVPPLTADAPVALALQEDLLTAINQNGVNTVERGELNRILDEHKIAETGLIDSASAKELGKFLQADAVLVGSVSDRGESLVINARWIDLKTGEAPAGASATQEVPKSGAAKGQKWLGFDARDLTANEKAELGVTAGVYVVGVTADGPADNANVRQGDVVTVLAGRALATLRDLVEALPTLPVGQPVSFRYVRKGMERDDVMNVQDAGLRGEVVRFWRGAGLIPVGWGLSQGNRMRPCWADPGPERTNESSPVASALGSGARRPSEVPKGRLTDPFSRPFGTSVSSPLNAFPGLKPLGCSPAALSGRGPCAFPVSCDCPGDSTLSKVGRW